MVFKYKYYTWETCFVSICLNGKRMEKAPSPWAIRSCLVWVYFICGVLFLFVLLKCLSQFSKWIFSISLLTFLLLCGFACSLHIYPDCVTPHDPTWYYGLNPCRILMEPQRNFKLHALFESSGHIISFPFIYAIQQNKTHACFHSHSFGFNFW